MGETDLKNQDTKSMNNLDSQKIIRDASFQDFTQAIQRSDIGNPHEQNIFIGFKRINIFHLMMLVKNDLLLLQRPCGTWSFLSGEIESSETTVLAACREAKEETGFNINPGAIFTTDHNLSGISPKGILFQGQSVWTRIDDFQLWRLNLKKDEIIDFQLVSMERAFGLLDKGFKESITELIHYKEHGIINS